MPSRRQVHFPSYTTCNTHLHCYAALQLKNTNAIKPKPENPLSSTLQSTNRTPLVIIEQQVVVCRECGG